MDKYHGIGRSHNNGINGYGHNKVPEEFGRRLQLMLLNFYPSGLAVDQVTIKYQEFCENEEESIINPQLYGYNSWNDLLKSSQMKKYVTHYTYKGDALRPDRVRGNGIKMKEVIKKASSNKIFQLEFLASVNDTERSGNIKHEQKLHDEGPGQSSSFGSHHEVEQNNGVKLARPETTPMGKFNMKNISDPGYYSNEVENFHCTQVSEGTFTEASNTWADLKMETIINPITTKKPLVPVEGRDFERRPKKICKN